MIRQFWFITGFTLILAVMCWAEPEKEIFVGFQGKPQRVTYNLYVPLNSDGKHLPVLVCVGGLPMDGDKYLQSDTRECMDENFKRFADENGIAILGLGFLFIAEDWETKTSYQYPKAWSGQALLEVLKVLAKDSPIDPEELYLFGISAGSQFSIRFAQMRPDISKAVASHAAGNGQRIQAAG